jgi:hypothetical protein
MSILDVPDALIAASRYPGQIKSSEKLPADTPCDLALPKNLLDCWLPLASSSVNSKPVEN